MAMLTRCPACETTFRVGPEQLQARGGTVRCGRCLTVFDGFRTLSAEPDPNRPATPAIAAAPSSQEPPVPAAAAAAAAPPPAEPAGEPEDTAATAPLPAPEPAAPHEQVLEPPFRLEPVSATELAAAAAAPPPADAVCADESGMGTGPVPRQLTLDEQLQREEARNRALRRRRLWGVAAALAGLAFAAHLVFAFRGDIVARAPATRAMLSSACAAIGCEINLPQAPRRVAIEASDLQALDPAQPGRIVLTATVRNHANHDLGYPALDLVLTNTREHTLARRIFLPQEYLGAGIDRRAGIAAKAEVTIRVELDTGDLNPAGFRLDLLAAPPS